MDDSHYTVPLLFGDPLQGDLAGAFIPYSMSNFTSVASKDCTSCATQYYDSSKSNSSNFPAETPSDYVTRQIGVVYQERGYIGTDKVCLPRSSISDVCADDVEFLKVTDVRSRVARIDGLFGLAPVDSKTGPSYVMQLYA